MQVDSPGAGFFPGQETGRRRFLMLEFVKKAFLIGAGLAVLTTEKIEEAVQEIVKKGELTEKEGKELIADLVDKSKRMKKDWGERIEKLVAEALRKGNIPTRKELEELRSRVEKLEKEKQKAE
jgi:polyhydroxyalkanoate synthesis regulator phasin